MLTDINNFEIYKRIHPYIPFVLNSSNLDMCGVKSPIVDDNSKKYILWLIENNHYSINSTLFTTLCNMFEEHEIDILYHRLDRKKIT
jgi:hypothetical protein